MRYLIEFFASFIEFASIMLANEILCHIVGKPEKKKQSMWKESQLILTICFNYLLSFAVAHDRMYETPNES